MTTPQPSFGLSVEVTNPGQFFACCGVLELAHRLWPSAVGWFNEENTIFCIYTPGGKRCTLKSISEKLQAVGVEGELSAEERDERSRLEALKRALRKSREQLSGADEKRRTELGKKLREGALRFGAPFNLRVDWWREDGDDVPKTFAGRQEVLRMARAMLSRISCALEDARPLHYRSLLRAAKETDGADLASNGEDGDSKVEPFYFDAARFAHPLDAGFSLDKQERNMKATAAPMTELLALIGVQRFRPRLTGEWTFEYFTWHEPLGVLVAAVVTSGIVAIAGARRYRFRLRFRDDQKRYKAFGFGVPMEVEK